MINTTNLMHSCLENKIFQSCADQSCADSVATLTTEPLANVITFSEYCSDGNNTSGALHVGDLVQKKTETVGCIYGIIEQIFAIDCSTTDEITCVVLWNQPHLLPDIVAISDLIALDSLEHKIYQMGHHKLIGTRVLSFLKYGRVALEKNPKQHGTMLYHITEKSVIVKWDEQKEDKTCSLDELLYIRQDFSDTHPPNDGQLVCVGVYRRENEKKKLLEDILYRPVRHRNDMDKIGILANYSEQYGFHIIFDTHHLQESWSKAQDHEYVFVWLSKMRYYGPKHNQAVCLPRFGNFLFPDHEGSSLLLGNRIENTKTQQTGTIVEICCVNGPPNPQCLLSSLLFNESNNTLGIWWDSATSIQMHTEHELCITCRVRHKHPKVPIPGSIVCGCPSYGARVSTFGPHVMKLPNNKEQYGTIVEINTLDKMVRVVLDSDDKIRDFPIGNKHAYSLVYIDDKCGLKIGQFVTAGVLGMMVTRNPLTSIHEPSGWGTIYALDKLYYYVIWHKTHQSEQIQPWICHTQSGLQEGSIVRFVWPLSSTTEAPK